MANKKRYTMKEVQEMIYKKYGRYTTTILNKSKCWDDNYRVGLQYFKNLIDVVDKMKLEE